jgi:adenosine kinase
LTSTFSAEYIAGGAGQNSIRVAQWMLGVPGSTAYFGSIGNDEYGDKLQSCATADGVLVHYQRTGEAATVY